MFTLCVDRWQCNLSLCTTGTIWSGRFVHLIRCRELKAAAKSQFHKCWLTANNNTHNLNYNLLSSVCDLLLQYFVLHTRRSIWYFNNQNTPFNHRHRNKMALNKASSLLLCLLGALALAASGTNGKWTWWYAWLCCNNIIVMRVMRFIGKEHNGEKEYGAFFHTLIFRLSIIWYSAE